MTSPAPLTAPAAPARPTRDWHLAAHVVLPSGHDPELLPLYVEYGARGPRIDDKYDRNMRGWGDYKGVEASGADSTEHRIEDVLTRRSLRIPAGERVSFATYFNALPVSYWRRWTDVDGIRLSVQVEGTATVMVYRSNARGAATRVHSAMTGAGEPGFDGTFTQVAVDLDLGPFVDGGWYWFDVIGGAEPATLVEADWFVHGSLQRPARLSIGVTTVNKVAYVDDLVAVIADSPELRAHLDTLYVVDQGTVSVTTGAQWADSASSLGDQLEVVAQANLGGSGGFSRGMFETMRAGRSTFHMVLDDDVRIEPEGILRAVRFGAFTTVATIVGAHMFDLHTPTALHSFGEVVDPVKWTFGPVLGVHEEWDLAASGLRETPWLHRRTDVNYNGWWMCLIPVEVLDAIGLSLPIFIKWDDAEHCLRAGAAGYPTVSFPGAAVWHVAFNDKDDLLEWQAYYHQRNLLICALLHSRQPHGGQAPMLSFQWLIKHGYSMRYSANALRLRGLRDLLSGPEGLHASLGTTLPQLRATAGEFADGQFRRDQGQFPTPSSPLGSGVPQLPPRSRLLPWVAKTAVRHLRPVRDDAHRVPDVSVPARYAVWWFLAQYDSAIVSRQDGTAVAFYERDRSLFTSQLREGLRLHLRVYREWDALAAQYRGALTELTSPRTWARTFGVDQD